MCTGISLRTGLSGPKQTLQERMCFQGVPFWNTKMFLPHVDADDEGTDSLLQSGEGAEPHFSAYAYPTPPLMSPPQGWWRGPLPAEHPRSACTLQSSWKRMLKCQHFLKILQNPCFNIPLNFWVLVHL